jgi:hypothetical protein
MSTFEHFTNAQCEIGGEDQFLELRSKHAQEPEDAEGKYRLNNDWERLLADLHVRTGTLLKADTVSILLGAGASKECGGPLMGTIPLEFERQFIEDGISSGVMPTVRGWLECFYFAVSRTQSAASAPSNTQQIIQRSEALTNGSAEALVVNFEALLSLIYRWRAAISSAGGRLRLDGDPEIDVTADVLDQTLRRATTIFAQLCNLPKTTAGPLGFKSYKDLLKKLLTRPLNLKRANIFTLNYDTLVEQAADAEGVVLVDGFVGSVRHTFRPESYDYDLYFPAETTEGRVHRLDRVLHLYKLHGSVNWTAEEPTWENPYGVSAHAHELPNDAPVLVYPTPAKWGDSLGMPYSELLRRFAATIVRPQSVLFVLGYGFGDDHICAIVRQALSVPSFTLVIVDPNPASSFIAALREQKDKRVWVFSGSTLGRFSGFVQYALADLREETVQRKVMETHRALSERHSTGEL